LASAPALPSSVVVASILRTTRTSKRQATHWMPLQVGRTVTWLVLETCLLAKLPPPRRLRKRQLPSLFSRLSKALRLPRQHLLSSRAHLRPQHLHPPRLPTVHQSLDVGVLCILQALSPSLRTWWTSVTSHRDRKFATLARARFSSCPDAPPMCVTSERARWIPTRPFFPVHSTLRI